MIQTYKPKPVSEAQIRAAIRRAIAEACKPVERDRHCPECFR